MLNQKEVGEAHAMLKLNKRKTITYIIISIMLIIIIFILKNLISKSNLIHKKQKNSDFIQNTISLIPNKITPININNNTQDESIIINTNEETTIQYKNNNWRIKIQKINLDAPILEGTEKEILRRGVGHFENSSKWDGNVCLAAHNRGYKYNYFQEIKKLELNDIIIYQTQEGERKYKVISNKIIQETDLSVIQNTKDNQLTLITCEQNEPKYRRCVLAKEC